MFDNNLPKVIYVATPERSMSYKYDSSYLLIDRANIEVLPIETLKSARFEHVTFPSGIRVNDVLIENPNEINSYILADKIADHKNDKFFHYKEIAAKLGATEYSIQFAEIRNTKCSIDAQGQIDVKTKGELKLNLEKKEESEHKLGFSIRAGWVGNSVITEESYIGAKNLLIKYRLEDDVPIKTLIEERNPHNKNLKKNELIQYSSSSMIQKNLDIALSIELCGMLELSSSVKMAMEEREETSLIISFTFPN